MSYTILKATKDRMPEAAKVFRTSFEDRYPHFPQLHTPEEDRNYFTNVVFEKGPVWIAEDQGNVVGFIAFDSEFISNLWMLPEFQRSGIGSRLLEVAMETYPHLKLWTFQENTAARAFYEKHGFQAIKFTEGEGNEEKQPDVLYEWKRKTL